MRKIIIRAFGLKGSWKWAKKQMLKGKVVRCKHWSGALKLRIDDPENRLLQACYCRITSEYSRELALWETSNHHLGYEDFTDYEVVEFFFKSKL